MGPNKEAIEDWFKLLQDDICSSIESMDVGHSFHQDEWTRSEGGGGRTRIFQGEIIEKGGVNFSAVHGDMPEKISTALNLGKTDFFATGVSIVLHPRNPFVPIIHMNVRYFETSSGPWWFGGGIDLTPHYVKADEAFFFHQMLKKACNKHSQEFYPKFKNWADDYFYIKHRNETRGIGGIFFDRLDTDNYGLSKASLWAFVQDIGLSFVPIYSELVNWNKDKPFNENHKKWQNLRRGRYVEFNLVWDRGTKFGLDTNGRTESILMSMPPMAQWEYNNRPDIATDEDYTLDMLKKGKDWTTGKEG